MCWLLSTFPSRPERVPAAAVRMPELVPCLHCFESQLWGQCMQDAAPWHCLGISKAAGEEAGERTRRIEDGVAIS